MIPTPRQRRARDTNPWRLLALTGIFFCTGAHAQASRVGGEFQVNRYTIDTQSQPRAAADRNGGFVVVLQSANQDGNSNGVFGQRFGSTGQPLGAEFQVNVVTTGSQSGPAVASFDDGGFVTAWVGVTNIFARRFDSAGATIAGEFQVNVVTGGFFDNSPAVAAAPGGAFVVAWESFARDGSSEGVFARRFDAAGVALGGDFQINSFTTGNQRAPAIAADATSGFVVAWQSDGNDGSGYGIFARRWTSSGTPLALEFRVNGRTVFGQRAPSVAASSAGGFVVSWESDLLGGSDSLAIMARRWSAVGAPLATEFQVNEYSQLFHRGAQVALDGDGDFVVAWHSYQDGSNAGVFARRYDASGQAVGGEFQVNTSTTSTQASPSLAMDPRGDFTVAWRSYGQDGDKDGVFAQRLALPRVFDLDDNGAAEPLTDGLLFLRYLFGFRGATLISGAVAPSCSRCTQVPIESYAATLIGPRIVEPAGVEFQINAYTGSTQTSPGIGVDAKGAFTVAWNSPQDGSGTGVFARRFASNGAPATAELQINDYVTGTQADPAIAVKGDGDFVVVWSSIGQDGAVSGVFGRRFSSSGAALAPEFQVPVRTLGAQTQPAIAMGASGSFLVTWTSDHDGGNTGIFARRFDSLAAPQGGEFQVNTYTPTFQRYSRSAIAPNGDFVVVWSSSTQDDGVSGGIFARRFGSSGAPLATEFQVNTYTINYQRSPAVAFGAAGFLVTWQSPNQDGNADGVFAQRFDSAGARAGVEFEINDATNGSQYGPSVTVGGDGGYVVTWSGYGAVPGGDGSYAGVFARRFDSAGIPRGPGFQVNTYVTDYQSGAVVASAPTGDFVVAWASLNQDGSSSGIFAQRYHALDDADIDGDGAAAPLTDGLLLLRWLFGFRGDTLIGGAVGPDCTRCTAPEIESYLAART